MISFLSVAVALAAFASPPPLPPADVSDQTLTCPLTEAGNNSAPGEALLEKAAERRDKGDLRAARGLLRQLLSGEGSDFVRLGALRMLINLQPSGDAAEIEPLVGCVTGEARMIARAWIALRQERHAVAAGLLQPLVMPRHHTLPRWSIAHESLGDAYAAMGRRGDAEAQWRLALATDYGPGHTGYDPQAVQRKIGASASGAGAEPLLPLVRYPDAVSILDVASIQPTDEGVRYSKIILLKKDEGSVAYGVDTYEVDCDQRRSRVVGVRAFNASGGMERESGPTPWSDDRPGDPFLPTERELVCGLDPANPLAPRSKTKLQMLSDYRADKPIFRRLPPGVTPF